MTAPPNVVWATLDSLRYDHTTMSGYRRDTSPKLNQIASSERGKSFSRCFSHSNYTLVSCPSILTGTYPERHGVGMGVNDRLPESIPTVAELLSEAGYRTGGVSEIARVSGATGLDRGFDHFEYTAKHDWGGYTRATLRAGASHFSQSVLPNIPKLRSDPRGLTNGVGMHYTHEVAKEYIAEQGSDPFFLYVHDVGPHYPYRPPLSHIKQYTGEIAMSAREAMEFGLEIFENNDSIVKAIANGCNFSDEEWEALHAMYDAEIAYSDALVYDLFRYVQRADIGDTVFVVTSDHGDLFGEKGLIAHRFVLHDGLVHVPMVTHGMGALCDIESDAFIQHADVMTTLVANAGGDTSSLQGLDLRKEQRTEAVFQLSPNEQGFDSYLAYNDDFDTDRFHHSVATGVRTENFKYQWSEDCEVLYELPNEEMDVTDRYPETRDDLSARCEMWRERIGDPVVADNQASFTDDMKQQLEHLGYI